MGNKTSQKKRVREAVKSDEDISLDEILSVMAENIVEIHQMLCNIHLMFDSLVKFIKGQKEHEA